MANFIANIELDIITSTVYLNLYEQEQTLLLLGCMCKDNKY